LKEYLNKILKKQEGTISNEAKTKKSASIKKKKQNLDSFVKKRKSVPVI
jgi:hypothetical protein